MIKSESVAMANIALTAFFYLSWPMFAFILPANLTIYGYLLTVGLSTIMYVVDYLNSDSFSKNYKIMKTSGLSEIEIWGSAIFMTLIFQVPGILLIQTFPDYSPDEWTMPNWQVHFAADKILAAAACVASTDGVFWLGHRLLHTSMARLHLLHHCCIYSSLSTSLFVHPLDLVFEFGAPTVWLFYACKYFFAEEPAWMFSLCMAFTSAWYALGHDEFMGGHHVAHHRSCASGYFIYKMWFYTNTDEEQVRHLIKKPMKEAA